MKFILIQIFLRRGECLKADVQLSLFLYLYSLYNRPFYVYARDSDRFRDRERDREQEQ
jgi:hypothetical protein